MNTQEIQMIIDAIVKLGEGGLTAFVWYLVASHIIPSFATLATCSGLFYTAYRIARLFRREANDVILADLEKAYEIVRYEWLYRTNLSGEKAANLRKAHDLLKTLVRDK